MNDLKNKKKIKNNAHKSVIIKLNNNKYYYLNKFICDYDLNIICI
jgi:hypothetical protein